MKFDAASIVRDHYREVWGFLRFLGCDRARADDLTQETFLVVLNKPFDDFNQKATASYLRLVARHVFLNSLRASERAKAREQALAAEEAWRPVSGEDGEGRIGALRNCLEAVEERLRRALELRYREGRAAREVASLLGMNEGALNTAMSRVKQSLKVCVERKLDHD